MAGPVLEPAVPDIDPGLCVMVPVPIVEPVPAPVVLWPVPVCPPTVELGTGAVFGAAVPRLPFCPMVPLWPVVPWLIVPPVVPAPAPVPAAAPVPAPADPTWASANGVNNASVAVIKSFFMFSFPLSAESSRAAKELSCSHAGDSHFRIVLFGLTVMAVGGEALGANEGHSAI